MTLDERIERVKPYFIMFNINTEEDATYVGAKFPETWTLPDKNALLNTYKVQVAPTQQGVWFATEIKNGADCVFDALDYVIEYNKKIEERKGILAEKLEEFKKIFATESVERLRTLTFVFGDEKAEETSVKKSSKGAKGKKKEEPVVGSDSASAEPIPEDSSLMAFAKNITGE